MLSGPIHKSDKGVVCEYVTYDDICDRSIVDKIFSTSLKEKLEGLKFFKEYLENYKAEHVYNDSYFDALRELMVCEKENKRIECVTNIDFLLGDSNITKFRSNIEDSMFRERLSFEEDDLLADIVKYSRIIIHKIATELPNYHLHLFNSGIMLNVLRSVEQDWAFNIVTCLNKESVALLHNYYDQHCTEETFLDIMIEKVKCSKTNEKEFFSILSFLNLLLDCDVALPVEFLSNVIKEVYYCLFQSYNENVYSSITEMIGKCPDTSKEVLFDLSFNRSVFPMALTYQFSSSSYTQRKYFLIILCILSKFSRFLDLVYGDEFTFDTLDRWFTDPVNQKLHNYVFDIVTSLLSADDKLVQKLHFGKEDSFCSHILDYISKKSICLESFHFIHLFKILLGIFLDNNIDLINSPLNIDMEGVLTDALILNSNDINDSICDIILLVLGSDSLCETSLRRSVNNLCVNYVDLLYDVNSPKVDQIKVVLNDYD